ncbi:MAG: hypothetical protein BWY82_02480 [Verrucomicrobia bacterium ADurb.Bin474]|nr:MAG: hypothetical protein BWY82_02480 [Verrucomicrobia bacterium ADurb.Bin474]
MHLLTLSDVSIRNNRDSHGLRNAGNRFPIRFPGISLLPGSSMNRHSLHPGIGQPRDNCLRNGMGRIPSKPHLGSDRSMMTNGFDHSPRDSNQAIRIEKQCRTRTLPDCPTGRASEVQIHKIRSQSTGDQPGRLGHRVWFPSKQLNPDRPLFVSENDTIPRIF